MEALPGHPGGIDLLRRTQRPQIDPVIVTGEGEGELEILADLHYDVDRIDGLIDGLADAQEVGQRQTGLHRRSHGPVGGEVGVGALVLVSGVAVFTDRVLVGTLAVRTSVGGGDGECCVELSRLVDSLSPGLPHSNCLTEKVKRSVSSHDRLPSPEAATRRSSSSNMASRITSSLVMSIVSACHWGRVFVRRRCGALGMGHSAAVRDHGRSGSAMRPRARTCTSHPAVMMSSSATAVAGRTKQRRAARPLAPAAIGAVTAKAPLRWAPEVFEKNTVQSQRECRG